MTIGVWILGDQLHPQQAALNSLEFVPQAPPDSPVLLVESHRWVQQRNYHKQKLVLVWSAMRHFAQELQALGYPVTYTEAETFHESLITWAYAYQLTEIRVMQPSDYPFRQTLETVIPQLPCKLHQIPSNHFLWSDQDFQHWVQGRKRIVMEDFYRQGRKRFQILLDGDQPCGGQWNFDLNNRQSPAPGTQFGSPMRLEPDAITGKVIEKVSQNYSDHFGELLDFKWAVNRSQALAVLNNFISERLPHFGPFQDAMVTGENYLWHALLSPYLNLGLLTPMEVILAAQQAYTEGLAPIASVEGFIRQILGWREYIHCLYEYWMPSRYEQLNTWNHQRPLPDFFWTGRTTMNCLHQTLDQIRHTGYAHHIQRLMVLSNFALISGINPQSMESWFHDVLIDSFDWVMQPNVLGMGLFADGGKLATKPYAASANYIYTMSDYCQNCTYSHKEKTGDRACPFNIFYWDFLIRHHSALKDMGRMGLVLSHLKRMDTTTQAQIQDQAKHWWQQALLSDPDPYPSMDLF